jgi:hypothetical protein
VRVPPSPPCLDGCAVTGLWAERGGGEECRWLSDNGFTGTLPTELGTLTAVTRLCVHRPHPPRLDVCAVTGLSVEGAQGGGRWESPDGRAQCSGTRRLLIAVEVIFEAQSLSARGLLGPQLRERFMVWTQTH